MDPKAGTITTQAGTTTTVSNTDQSSGFRSTVVPGIGLIPPLNLVGNSPLNDGRSKPVKTNQNQIPPKRANHKDCFFRTKLHGPLRGFMEIRPSIAHERRTRADMYLNEMQYEQLERQMGYQALNTRNHNNTQTSFGTASSANTYFATSNGEWTLDVRLFCRFGSELMS